MNQLNKMGKREWQVILECLKASAYGPFFPDEEFNTIFGLERYELETVIDEWWTDDPKPSRDVIHAINNSLNNLLGYPHREDHLWADYISVSRREVKRIFRKWKDEQVTVYIHDW